MSEYEWFVPPGILVFDCDSVPTRTPAPRVDFSWSDILSVSCDSYLPEYIDGSLGPLPFIPRIVRHRDYIQESNSGDLPKSAVSVHPLGGSIVTPEAAEAASQASDPDPHVGSGGEEDEGKDEVDPLSAVASEADPLSAAVSASTLNKSTVAGVMDDSFEPWSMKRPGILARYTTNEKLSISGESNGGKARVVSQNSNGSMSDKVKQRLEQLDDEGNLQEALDLSQAEYVNRIDELNTQLKMAWDADQRVKALKIAIQCAKLLADTSVIQFYPSKFVLITDILHNFGMMVRDRIYEKCAYFPPGSNIPKQLPSDFTPDMVPPAAKETCRNWFFKIASIRELIPRLYVEASILGCYQFLTSGEYEAALRRLTMMFRGIGDPLVAAYSRCFLCRVGVNVAPEVQRHLLDNFIDFGNTYSQIEGTVVQAQLKAEGVSESQYLQLYIPALDWILQCIAYRASDETLDQILQMVKDKHNVTLLINAVMSAFPPSFISARAVMFCHLIRDASDDGLPKHHLYRTLGMNVTFAAPPKDQRLPVLNDVWKVVMKLENPADYVACSEVWIEYPAQFFGRREVNAMLGDCITHVTPDRAYEKFLPQLQSMIAKVVTHMKDFNDLFTMSNFLPFLDLFRKDALRVEVCRSVMEAFARNTEEMSTDPVILHSLMSIGKILHDSVSALTFEDELKQINYVISVFVRKVGFGRDFEQTLNFLVDARGAFFNLDPVQVALVSRVVALAMNTHKLVKGKHSKKTASFVRSCFAFAFITIPSIHDPFSKLSLFLEAGAAAVTNGCLGQAEASFRTAIKLMAVLPDKIKNGDGDEVPSHEVISNMVPFLLNTLLILGDNPEFPPLHMAKTVLNMVAEFDFQGTDGGFKLFNQSISLLAAYSQPKYRWSLPNAVPTNETLYSGSPNFIKAVTEMVENMILQVLLRLKEIGSSEHPEGAERQLALALDLFGVIVRNGNLEGPKMNSLAANLWNLARKAYKNVKNHSAEIKSFTALRSFVETMALQEYPGMAQLLAKISV